MIRVLFLVSLALSVSLVCAEVPAAPAPLHRAERGKAVDMVGVWDNVYGSQPYTVVLYADGRYEAWPPRSNFATWTGRWALSGGVLSVSESHYSYSQDWPPFAWQVRLLGRPGDWHGVAVPGTYPVKNAPPPSGFDFSLKLR